MTEPTDTRLIAAHLSAALISSGTEMTGHPVADALRIYSEVLQALKETERLDQTERMGKVLDSLGDGPHARSLECACPPSPRRSSATVPATTYVPPAH